MAVEAAEIAAVREAPDNNDWNSCWLRRPDTEVANTSNNVEHTFANEWIRHQFLYILLCEIGLFKDAVDEGASESIDC